jgi:hypothetical protein
VLCVCQRWRERRREAFHIKTSMFVMPPCLIRLNRWPAPTQAGRQAGGEWVLALNNFCFYTVLISNEPQSRIQVESRETLEAKYHPPRYCDSICISFPPPPLFLIYTPLSLSLSLLTNEHVRVFLFLFLVIFYAKEKEKISFWRGDWSLAYRGQPPLPCQSSTFIQFIFQTGNAMTNV